MPRSVENRIRDVYWNLAAYPRAWVPLTDLRRRLDVPRAEQDAALRAMQQHPSVRLVAVADPKMLTVADRAAALHIGGADTHLLSLA